MKTNRKHRTEILNHSVRAAEAALEYLERNGGDLAAAGDALGEDLDRCLAELEELGDKDTDVRPLLRPVFERLAALSLVWLTCAPKG